MLKMNKIDQLIQKPGTFFNKFRDISGGRFLRK